MKMPGLERRGAPTAPKFASLRAVSGQMTDDARRAIILRAIKVFLRSMLPGLPMRRDIMSEMRDFIEYPLYDLRGLGFFVVQIIPVGVGLSPEATISVSFDCLRVPSHAAPSVILCPPTLPAEVEAFCRYPPDWEFLPPPGPSEPVLRLTVPYYSPPQVLDHPRCRCAAPVPSRMTPPICP